MVRTVDNRIRVLIENGVKLGHRTMFFLIGDIAREQVVIFHHMLTNAMESNRPNILWCFKKEMGFKSNSNKRLRNLKKKVKTGSLNLNEDDSFELLIASTNIRFCHYTETEKILGNTYGMCVLQDFDAITPNTLARTIETVKGGGLIIFLLPSVKSLNQLYNLPMKVHERYRTEAHQEIIGRFNERFILSLSDCKRCLILDEDSKVLPLTSQNLQIEPVEISDDVSDNELKSFKKVLRSPESTNSLIDCCKTTDQAKALLKFIEAISERNLRSTVSLTAARGRGKSATLGLAIASAVAFGYSNIFVSSPSPENLSTLFEFIFKGFDALKYKEHDDYDIVQATKPEYNKAIVRVNINLKHHRQTIQYIHPNDSNKLGQAELVVIDEAAAIPLPLVRSLIGSYLVFLASTINGYEGTGRSLSLKLLYQLRQQSVSKVPGDSTESAKNRILYEIELNESIRYSPNDDVECWLTSLLCLDATAIIPIISSCPPPEKCDLYYINRETLFSYHRASEGFLQRLVALFVSSHYKNSPNDLQMMCDAPAHHLFCLLGPVDPDTESLPEVLVVIQVCLEGQISSKSIKIGLQRGKRASGDLIPWAVAQQYYDIKFPQLSGARIVRIATHPDYQSMGYGRYALELLHKYYRHDIKSLDEENESKENSNINKELPKTNKESLLEENVEPRDSLPPLLLKLSERPPENLDYLGVSYGLTPSLLRFWKRGGFVPVYLRQTKNDLTGEHSCIMLSSISPKFENLRDYFLDFRRRIISLLGYQFSEFPTSLGLSLLSNNLVPLETKDLTKVRMKTWLNSQDINRLEMYSNNLIDFHLIVDLLPVLAQFYFKGLFGDVKLSAVQTAIVLGIGLQRKNIDTLAKELDLSSAQLLGLFNKTIRRCTQYLKSVLPSAIEKDLKKKNLSNNSEDEDNESTNNEIETVEEQIEKKNKNFTKTQEDDSHSKRNKKKLEKSLKRSSDENESEEEFVKKKKKQNLNK